MHSNSRYSRVGHHNSRPYCSKVLRCDSIVIIPVHLEEHFLPLPEEAAPPKRIITVSTDSGALEVGSSMLLPDLDGVQHPLASCVGPGSEKPGNSCKGCQLSTLVCAFK